MPGRTPLSAEAIRHIASGEIGIREAKSRYGIGEHRVRCIRQGLEVARDEQPDILREQAEVDRLRAEVDRLRAEVDRLRAVCEADLDRILVLEDLAGIEYKPMCRLAEHRAQEDTAATLSAAKPKPLQAEEASSAESRGRD